MPIEKKRKCKHYRMLGRVKICTLKLCPCSALKECAENEYEQLKQKIKEQWVRQDASLDTGDKANDETNEQLAP